MLLLYCSPCGLCLHEVGFPQTWRSTTTINGTSGYALYKNLLRRVEIRDSLQCVYRHINHPCIIHAPSNYANPNYFWGNYHALSANSQDCLGFPTHYIHHHFPPILPFFTFSYSVLMIPFCTAYNGIIIP